MNLRFNWLLICLIMVGGGLQGAKNCKNKRICPEPQSCITVKTRLDQIQQELDACCESLLDQCDSFRARLISCSPAQIVTQEFVDTPTLNPITESGVYCLTETITGQIIIDADNVTIDMNDFSISATGSNCIVCSGHNNISIVGRGVLQDATVAGLELTSCTEVFVDRMVLRNNTNGISFSTVENFVIRDSFFFDQTTTGLELASSSNGMIGCTNIQNTAGQAITIDSNSTNVQFRQVIAADSTAENWSINGQNCLFRNCLAQNGTIGFDFGASASDCYASCCQANQQTNDGFALTNSVKIVLSNCQSLNNTGTGFVVQATDSCLQECVAKENGSDGFAVNGATNSYLTGNIAVSNVGNGYFVSGTDNVLLSNYAEANGTNYAGATVPLTTYTISTGLFSPTAFPSIWQNITAVP